MTSINKSKISGEEYISKDRLISYYNQARLIRGLGQQVNNILEIGIFNSLFTEMLKRGGYNVTTADFDVELKPDMVLDLASDFTLPEDKFDVIAIFQVLEHIPYEDAEKALKKLADATKKFLVISVPYRSRFLSIQFKFSLSLRPKYFFVRIPLFWSQKPLTDEHHWEMGLKGYPKKRLVNSIEKAGFIIKREFIDPLNPYHYFFVLGKNK
ncbi:class I SAM-dependent methyltransferase [Coleofasciculus sp. FACHB-T130]|uniref:class I SAM-dependent methyltransferase n=1 Tax=Cyanophyceae TaxID=3028117 RepID=UPI001682E516|nr:class I SAM-dependent methyltransferase [Coleofasciculus sp. FACHB-T130]MBD1882291.1 methyltransferase type 11 [Coleofasciculus sp. FACHB-T130]